MRRAVISPVEAGIVSVKGSIKPLAYLKKNAADVLAAVSETRSPVIITHNGEAKAVVQDFHTYQEAQSSLAFLKVVALGRESVERGRCRPARTAFAAFERRRKIDGRHAWGLHRGHLRG